MRDIKRLHRRTIYENRWMTVHEDAVRFPSGSEGIYGVVDKPDFALIVPLQGDGRVQLVAQYRYPVAGRYWECPQGSWETRPEADPEAVALGELEEETGFRAGRLRKIGHLFEAYGFSNQGFHVFVAEQLTPGTMAREASEQDMETAAFTRDEIARMIAQGEIKDAPTVAALALVTMAQTT